MRQMVFKCPSGRDDIGGFRNGDAVCSGNQLLDRQPESLPSGAKWVGFKRFEQWAQDGFLIQAEAVETIAKPENARGKARKSRGSEKWRT